MIGHVNGIVESLAAADNVKSSQNTANTNAGKFSDYLDSALLNYRTGLLTGSGMSNYSYLNALSGTAWQSVVLKALKDELKKELNSDESESTVQEDESAAPNAVKKKKPDWATIRVIQHYKSPRMEENAESKGVLV